MTTELAAVGVLASFGAFWLMFLPFWWLSFRVTRNEPDQTEDEVRRSTSLALAGCGSLVLSLFYLVFERCSLGRAIPTVAMLWAFGVTLIFTFVCTALALLVLRWCGPYRKGAPIVVVPVASLSMHVMSMIFEVFGIGGGW